MGKANENMEWEVHIKEESLKDAEEAAEYEEDEKASVDGIYDYEISLVRKGNEHRHVSWGWDDASGGISDKIILFSRGYNNLGMTDDEVVPPDRWEWGIKTAQAFCDALNKREGVNRVPMGGKRCPECAAYNWNEQKCWHCSHEFKIHVVDGITGTQKIAMEGLLTMTNGHLSGVDYEQAFIGTFGTKKTVQEVNDLNYEDAEKMSTYLSALKREV